MNLVTKLSARIGFLEDDLKKTKQIYSSAFTKFILRVKKQETQIKTGKARRKARIVHSEDEDITVDSSKQGRKISKDPNVFLAQDEGVEWFQDDAEKGQSEVSTTGATQDTASEVPIVSIAEVNISTADRIVYSRRSKETRKDKGKAIMSEHEPKKVTTKDIDWNDPSVQRYRDMKSKPKSEAQERKNMIIYLKNQGNYKMKDFKGMSYDQIRPIFDKRKKSLSKKRTKKQKVELDDEKEDLKGYLDIVPREEVTVDVDSLSTKYPIVDWKTYSLTKNLMYYKIIRGDGSSKHYKILSEMLDDFDRQDVEDLYRLVKDRYSTSRPEG
ncbi:hypothetical protein Tco_1534820, partial [Tanacetum coccineum]